MKQRHRTLPSEHADIVGAVQFVKGTLQADAARSRRSIPHRRQYPMAPLIHRDQVLAMCKEYYFPEERSSCMNRSPRRIFETKIEAVGLDWSRLLNTSKTAECTLAYLYIRALLMRMLGQHVVDSDVKPNKYTTPETLLRLIQLLTFRGCQLPLTAAAVETKLRRAIGFALPSSSQKLCVNLLPLESPEFSVDLVSTIQSYCIITFEAAAYLESHASSNWASPEVLEFHDIDALSKLNVARGHWLVTLLLANGTKLFSSSKLFVRLCNCMRSVNASLKATICKALIEILVVWHESILRVHTDVPLPSNMFFLKLFRESSFIPHMRLSIEKRIALERRQRRLSFSTYVQTTVHVLAALNCLEERFVTHFSNAGQTLEKVLPPKLVCAMPYALHLMLDASGHELSRTCVYELRLSEAICGMNPSQESYRLVYRGSHMHAIVGDLMPSRAYHFKLRVIATTGVPLTTYSERVSYETSTGSPCVFDKGKCGTDILVSKDGLTSMYVGNESWSTIMGSTPLIAGVNTWEITIEASETSYLFIGVAQKSADLQTFLGGDDCSWGFIGDRALYHKRTKLKMYGERFGEGDVVTVSLDTNFCTLSFQKNGIDLGVAFKGLSGDLYPAVAFYNRGQRVRLALSPSMSPGAGIVIAQSPCAYGIDDFFHFLKIMLSISIQGSVQVKSCYRVYEIHKRWYSGFLKWATSVAGYSLLIDDSDAACFQHGVVAGQQLKTPRGIASVRGVGSGLLWCHCKPETGLFFLAHPEATRAHEPRCKVAMDFERYSAILTRQHNINIDRVLIDVIDTLSLFYHANPWNVAPRNIIEEFRSQSLLKVSEIFDEQDLLDSVLCRASLLLSFNQEVPCSLPFLMHASNLGNQRFTKSWITGGLCEIKYPSLVLSLSRNYIFAFTKKNIFNQYIRYTTAQAKKAEDDYDYPDDLPLVVLNRRKALVDPMAAPEVPQKAYSLILSSFTFVFVQLRLSSSVFGQLFDELHFLEAPLLRMGYMHPMDDGQERTFKVKFDGEGVDDYGGPYREVFAQIPSELQAFKCSPDSSRTTCYLPVFQPTPNTASDTELDVPKFILRPQYTAPMYLELCNFPGQLVGIALRSKVSISQRTRLCGHTRCHRH